MATVTVQNTLTDPSGNPLANYPVSVSLVTGSTIPGYTTTSSIIWRETIYTNASGLWSMNLTPNSTITPANSYYKVIEGNGLYTSYIVVPASGGPYNLASILVTPPTPAAVGITGVQVAASGTIAGSEPEVNFIPGTNFSLTAVDNPTNKRVDVTLNSTAVGVNYRGTWTPTTAYAVNDLVVLGGARLLCTTAHTSGATFALANWADLTSPVGVYNVMLYGAKGDNTTDDTAAINSAVTAAYNAGVAAGTFYAEVYFPPARYLVAGVTTQGGTTFGNAQIPLPVPAVTGQKFTMVFRGGRDNAGLWHWQQTTAQVSGSVLRSTLVGTNDVTFGEASVIGGPTPAQGYGQAASLFSNMLLVVDGINIVVPNDPHVCGVDAAGIAELHVINLSVKANATPATVTAPTQAWQVGLRCPDNNNNDYTVIDQYTCEGMNYGLIANEHMVANEIACIYCVAAVEAGRGAATSHGSKIRYLSAESCQVGLGAVLGSFPVKIDVDLLDWEGGSGGFANFAVINDAPNRLYGTVAVTTVGVATHLTSGTGGYTVNGATNLRVYDMARQAGNAGTVATPSSGVATLNPLFRDSYVNLSVTGGTITAVVIDAQTLAGVPTQVFVPTNKSITVTYTGTLSWTWTIQ